MPDIQQNTLYLTTHGSYVARDHLTLQVEVPVYPDDLPREERSREHASDWRKLSIPIHMLESICVFGASSISQRGSRSSNRFCAPIKGERSTWCSQRRWRIWGLC